MSPEWMDLNQSHTDISMRDRTELIRFDRPCPHFLGHMRSKSVKECLICTNCHEWTGRFEPNLHIHNNIQTATVTGRILFAAL